MISKHFITEKFADLHLHTNFSDGTFTPENLVKEAMYMGISTIAITDHDILDGIEPGILAGKKYGVEVIPGVELSARSDDDEAEIHILGYYMDLQNEKFRERLLDFRETRVIRARKIVDKLNELGMEIEYDDVLKLADSSSVGRPHVATALVEKGYVTTNSEAFNRYLFDGGPAYVQKKKISPAGAIAMILNAGGVPILAHPGMIQQDIIPELISMGLMGLEAFHPFHSIQLSNYYCDLAKRYKILITGGSDCHGEAKSKTYLGSVRLPYKHVDALKQAKDYVLEMLDTGC